MFSSIQPQILKNLLLVFLLTNTNCHAQHDWFNENDYMEAQRGHYLEYDYVVTLINKTDTNYKLRLFYQDSMYSNSSLFGKSFYFKEVLNGPFRFYINGNISEKSMMVNGKKDGESISYNVDGIIVEKSFYKNGTKIGTWEFFDTNGRLFKRMYYDNNGRKIKTEIYDAKGNLARTEKSGS